MSKKVKIIVGSSIGLLILLILLIVGISLMWKRPSLSTLEEKTLRDTEKDVMLYFDKIDTENNGIEQYITFALELSTNENNKTELNFQEISDIVSKYFNTSLNEEDLKNNGISALLASSNITYNDEEKTYAIHKDKLTQQDIANKEIAVYNYNTAKKQKDKYVVNYKKYLIKNPYNVFNYFKDKGSDDAKADAILKYLKGDGNSNIIKSSVDSSMINDVADYQKDIELTYIVKDNKLLIDSIN